MNKPQPFLYLAPIRGLTDALFRETLANHFSGFDAAVAPFITSQKKSLYEDKQIRDVLPENNPNLPVIPQLLHTDPEDFLVLARRLAGLGYTHINWNLGCPAPMIARKKRGSGLLPFPDEIIGLLDRVLPELEIELSIKTRLGFNELSETRALLPKLDCFKLKEIIIHARLGKQLYKGTTDPAAFDTCRQLSRHAFAYNGDINDSETFRTLADRFPSVNRWMIGRGALSNPFLAEEIKGYPQQSAEERKKRLYAFHEELYNKYTERLFGPSHMLGRVKQLWIYLIASFPGNRKMLKKIVKSSSLEIYRDNIERLFEMQQR